VGLGKAGALCQTMPMIARLLFFLVGLFFLGLGHHLQKPVKEAQANLAAYRPVEMTVKEQFDRKVRRKGKPDRTVPSLRLEGEGQIFEVAAEPFAARGPVTPGAKVATLFRPESADMSHNLYYLRVLPAGTTAEEIKPSWAFHGIGLLLVVTALFILRKKRRRR
jgi:hypothetical protein